tara:strand:- start:26997 stop:27887 length:891 start_codon:yes stop_codon:yes gene_type:complete
MIKIFILFTIILYGCSSSKNQAMPPNIDFDYVLNNENLSDKDKLIELQIELSRQEDIIKHLNEQTTNLNYSLDSLRFSNDSIIFILEQQIDSFRLEQSMLIGPEFSNNIIKLYNKVNILEDRALFMDSLYFELITDMVLIENQISSIENSIKEIDAINDEFNRDKHNSKNSTGIDFSYQYKVAHQLYTRGNYKNSLEKFKFLLDNNIPIDLADNCQFWIGQIYFSNKDYVKAIYEFEKVLAYKESNKKSESIYKIGLSNLKLGNNTDAKKMFQDILDNYPKSKYFNKASEFLITLN